ncbi:MAG: hypothetical protein Kow0092_24900 [Deferrisomatales bacterium]
MKRFFPALTGLFLAVTAALALGGCGHWPHGYCGTSSGPGAYASADAHRHGPGCGHPYAP